jgi:hypothetical protein
MTPNEKAIKLYGIFNLFTEPNKEEHHQAKRCAINHLKRKIFLYDLWPAKKGESIDFLNLVIKELKLL